MVSPDLTITLFEDIFQLFMTGGQNLELRNAKRPIFQNFKIANIKITKRFDSFICEFIFSSFRNLNTQNN